LPTRIRDEDCDVESLSPSDFEVDTDEELNYLFARAESGHPLYAIKMVEITKLPLSQSVIKR
jgi:hypothetical protein